MFFLIITFCSSAAMTDCQVQSLGQVETLKQCEAVAQVHRMALGPEGENNYRIECEEG